MGRPRKNPADKAKPKPKAKPKARPVKPSDIAPLYPWECQPNESHKAYNAFVHYLETEVNRSVRGTCRELGKTWSSISNWSARHDWVARAKAYDKYEESRRRAILRKAIDKMYERQANHAVAGMMAAMETLKPFIPTANNASPQKMRPRDAIRLFDVMARAERNARGEPESYTKVDTGGVPSAGSDDERAKLVKLMDDPDAVEHLAAISKIMGTDGSRGGG